MNMRNNMMCLWDCNQVSQETVRSSWRHEQELNTKKPYYISLAYIRLYCLCIISLYCPGDKEPINHYLTNCIESCGGQTQSPMFMPCMVPTCHPLLGCGPVTYFQLREYGKQVMRCYSHDYVNI